jgi:hypothetical protein
MKIMRAGRHASRRIAALTAAAAAGLLATAGIAGSAHASSAHASAGTSAASGPTLRATLATAKPSIVLVHGAWADSSSWDAVVSRPRDRHQGHPRRRPRHFLTGHAGAGAEGRRHQGVELRRNVWLRQPAQSSVQVVTTMHTPSAGFRRCWAARPRSAKNIH